LAAQPLQSIPPMELMSQDSENFTNAKPPYSGYFGKIHLFFAAKE
jgi:hypothetical protein